MSVSVMTVMVVTAFVTMMTTAPDSGDYAGRRWRRSVGVYATRAII